MTNLNYLFGLLRFRSWVGWLAIFGVGSFIFSLPQIFDVIAIGSAFCCITSAVFVENQYFDKEIDQKNPKKNTLPLAANKVSPNTTLILLMVLCGLGFGILTFYNAFLLPIFLTYFALCSVYSTPILHLKGKPILDIIVAGIGSGVFPFLIGLLAANQLSLDIHLPWVSKAYQDAILCIVPLFLFQIASQIFQEVRDFHSDKENNIKTFVVRYGIKKSIKVATIAVILAISLPIFFGLLNLSLTSQFIYYYLLIIILLTPILVIFARINKNPSKIEILYKFSMKYTPIILIMLFVYIFILRINLA
ncbi:MAG: UbiA family prenyltransferase [Candidatus Bathyarchaeota archaeon]